MNFGGRNMLVVIGLAVIMLTAVAGFLPSFALDSDKNQPAVLEADDFELDLASGVRTYRGNVVFRQGSTHLQCDELVTHYNDEHLDKGVCTGKPGQFKQRPEGKDSDVLGRARSITLDRVKGIVIFENRADIKQAGIRMAGKLITYDMVSKKIRVSGGINETGATNDTRPRLTIQQPD